MESRKVLCCGAKTWSLVIGWVQTIISGILLAITVIGLVVFIFHIGSDKSTQDNTNNGATIVGMLIGIITLLIGLVAGIILILGVKQENAHKLKIWIIIEIIFLVLSVVGIIMGLFNGSVGSLVRDILTILVSLFCIWVVNIHRFELLNAGVGRVAYGGKV